MTRGDGPVEEVGLGDGDLVVLRALAGLGGDREGLPEAEEVGGLEARVQERSLQPRDPASERELVPVLLLNLERHVQLVLALLARMQLRCPLHRLEIPELVDPLDRQLQKLRVEHVALVQVHLTPNHLVPRALVPREVDVTHVVTLVLVHHQGHVHDLLLEVRPPLRRSRPLEISLRPVKVPQLVVPLLDLRIVVDIPRVQLEQRPRPLLLQDRQTLELDLPDLKLLPLRHRNLETHVLLRLLPLLRLRVLDVRDLRLTHPRHHVPTVQEEILDPRTVPRILLAPVPLVLGIGGLAPQPGQIEQDPWP